MKKDTGLKLILQKGGSKVENEAIGPEMDAASLQQQNDNLRAVIARMREDMERLGAEFPNNQSSRGKPDSVTTGNFMTASLLSCAMDVPHPL